VAAAYSTHSVGDNVNEKLLIAGASCAAGDLSMNSKCYKKFDSSLTWYNASNDCLSRGGSLAVFTDIGRPSDNSQLTTWLHTSNVYWIGLIRSWWKTTSDGWLDLLRYLAVKLFSKNSNLCDHDT